jgi:tetratricopeptide (TPR) repeat protein
LRIPIDLLRTRVLIHLLPKGSLKFLSEAQLRAFVERTAKESNSQTSQQDLRVRPDLSRYLKEWAIQYGFSVDEVRAELDHWAAEVASRKASSYDLSLAAFANQNFREANKRALDAAAEAESKLTSLEKEQHAAVDRIVQAYHLAGDAAYNALDFDNAERAYDKALAHTNRNLAATQWADLQLRIGNCERELSYLSEGVAITRHAESARKAYDLALEV